MNQDNELSKVSGSPHDPLAAAIRLTALIRENSDQTERDRCLAEPVVAAMRRAGLLSLGLPAALGGTETPVAAAMRAIEQVAYADGSTGWNAMIAYDAGLWSGYLSSPATRALLDFRTEVKSARIPAVMRPMMTSTTAISTRVNPRALLAMNRFNAVLWLVGWARSYLTAIFDPSMGLLSGSIGPATRDLGPVQRADSTVCLTAIRGRREKGRFFVLNELILREKV